MYSPDYTSTTRCYHCIIYLFIVSYTETAEIRVVGLQVGLVTRPAAEALC